MTDSGETKDDVKLPDSEEGRIIKERFENGDTLLVTVQVRWLPLSIKSVCHIYKSHDLAQLF